MKTYLIQYIYDEYCQGYEETVGMALVYAENFEEAVKKLDYRLPNDCNPRSFRNLTFI